MPPPKGSSLWDNPEFLSNVIIGLYEAGTISKGLSPKMREGIVQYLNNCGHSVTWEGIRSMQRWDAHTHEDILLALFQHVKIPTSDIQKVMGELKAKGYTFTENALRYNSLFGFSRGWDENSHRDLLLAFIYETKATKAIITNITERMKLMGHTYSFDAIKYSLAQHVQKLRKQKDISSIQNAGGMETPTKGTPSKATPRKGASAKKAAGKGSRKRFASDDSEIDDDDFKKEEGLSDVERSPSKKPVKRVKKEPSPGLDDDCQV
ncbi:unnamed protein product [Clonostachys rhizophaga]|uniref:Uncharacterized protein n=1 Tax=Clonostachys rhizophaga TaxID=160324 RepID=A0A9N9VAJ8_9HYPO|nr:unnamed protein product [Clonostachys rhizophaga]